MEKPFDFKVLAERCKAKGLPMLEEQAEMIAKEFFGWTKESLDMHTNPLVKIMGQAAVASLEPMAMGAIDKIDGQPG